MRLIEQHRPQTILALLQIGTVLVGSLGIGAILRGSPDSEQPLALALVRNWGYLLLVIPLGWVVATIRLETRHEWYSKRYTIVSGLLLIACLVWFFVDTLGRVCFMTMGNS